MDRLTENCFVKNTAAVKGILLSCTNLNEIDDINMAGYLAVVKVERTSGKNDKIKIIISQEKDVTDLHNGKPVMIIGSVQTHKDKKTGHVCVFVLADYISALCAKGNDWMENEIYLHGVIGNGTNYRITPTKKRICDLIIKVPAENKKGKICYIPSICWGKMADRVKKWKKGTEVVVRGRMQSREYVKCLPDGSKTVKIAYELSIFNIKKRRSVNE